MHGNIKMTQDYKEGYKDGFKDGFEAGKKEQPKPVDFWNPYPTPFPGCSVCGRNVVGISNYVCHRSDCPSKMYWTTTRTG